MTVPSPTEIPAGAAAHEDGSVVTREEFLNVFEGLYDRLREGSRAQLEHAVTMCQRELGGVLIFQLPSRQSKRPRPEAAYVSEMPEGVRVY